LWHLRVDGASTCWGGLPGGRRSHHRGDAHGASGSSGTRPGTRRPGTGPGW